MAEPAGAVRSGGDGQQSDGPTDDVISAVHEGRSSILLTSERITSNTLPNGSAASCATSSVLQGGMTAKARHRSADQLASLPDTAERLVLATGRFIGEGFDDARLDTLFLAMPVSWKGATYRAIGYAGGEAPLGFAEPLEEQTVEYDQEALRHFEENP